MEALGDPAPTRSYHRLVPVGQDLNLGGGARLSQPANGIQTSHNDKVITTEERDYLIKLNEQRMDFMYGVAHGVAYLLDPVLLNGGIPSTNRCSLEDELINKPIDDEQPVDDAHRRQINLEYTK